MPLWEAIATHSNTWIRVRYVFDSQDKAAEWAELLHADGYSVVVQII